MRITSIRSSSYTGWDYCPMSFYFTYCLNVPSKGNLKAAVGSATHKALELLALRRLAGQRGEARVVDGDEGGGAVWRRDDLTAEVAAGYAFDLYRVREPHHAWTEAERRTIADNVRRVLTGWGGRYSPLNRAVEAVEHFFDFELPHEWAEYDYGPDDRGRVRLRGTVDLITRAGPRTLEVIDYKTGRRLCWATGEEKTYETLQDDPQLLLYHYALKRAFPAEQILFTLLYVNDGGPFTMAFGDEDIPRFERMLRQRVEEIRSCEVPGRIWGDWKCKRLCEHSKSDETGVSRCERVHGEILSLGMDRVTDLYRDRSREGVYQGGGRTT